MMKERAEIQAITTIGRSIMERLIPSFGSSNS